MLKDEVIYLGNAASGVLSNDEHQGQDELGPVAV